jgi:copper homeostasis protein CutC
LKHLAVHIIPFFLLLASFSCGENELYRQRSKTLDSLGGAVNAMVQELHRTDTITMLKAVQRYNYYRQFINQNVNDTLSKAEAEQLQHFFTAGSNLENYRTNRYKIMARAEVVASQLKRLSDDTKNKSMDLHQLSAYCENENREAGTLVQTGYTQEKSFHTALEEFRNSMNGVEQIIRSRNHGELPTIIKDSVPF